VREPIIYSPEFIFKKIKHYSFKINYKFYFYKKIAMSEPTTFPLVFKCSNCKKQSSYPNLLQKGTEDKGATIVVKRCITCGQENKVELPKGWIGIRSDEVMRGMKDD